MNPRTVTNLRRLYEAACKDRTPNRFYNEFADGLREKHFKPEEFSIRQLFETFVPNGREAIQYMDPRTTVNGINLLEAGGTAVDTAAFTNISGQLMFTTVLDSFQDPNFVSDRVARTIQTQFNGEKIPGIGRLGDVAGAIGEGLPYPYAGLSEEYIETPQTVKRGFIVPVTKEAVFFDRTGILLERAGETGYWLGINKEKRVVDVATGQTNNYKRNGTSENTYQDGTPSFDNVDSSALVDWTDIESALLLFDSLTDPNTGEPIIVVPDTLIVPTALLKTAERIISATEIQYGARSTSAPSDGVTSANLLTVSGNPIKSNYEIVSSPVIQNRTSSTTSWFLGQPRKAFAYMQNWDITTQQARSNSEAEFERDVVAQFKVSERGVAAVLEPRYMVKGNT